MPKLLSRVIMLGVLLILIGGCGSGQGSSTVQPVSPGTEVGSAIGDKSNRPARMAPPSAVRGSADYLVTIDAPADIMRKSPEVVIGTVIEERRGVIHGPEEDRQENRILIVDVLQALKGAPPDPLEIETVGWALPAGKAKQPFLYEDAVWLEVGDRILVAVSEDKDRDGLRGLLNDQAVFLLGGGRVLTTDRTHPVVRRLEGLSETELLQQIRSG